MSTLNLNSSSKILVIGGGLDLNPTLRRQFAKEGFYDITFFPDNYQPQFKLLKTLQDSEFVEEWLSEYNLVVYTHAYVSYNKRDHRVLLQENVLAIQCLVNSLLYLGSIPLVFVSTTEALDRKEGGHQISEPDTWQRNKFRTQYSKSRFLGELEVWRGIAEGLDALIVSPTNLVSPQSHNTLIRLLVELTETNILYTAPGKNGFVGLEDVCSFISASLKLPDIWNDKYILNSINLDYNTFFSLALQINKVTPMKTASISYLTHPLKRAFYGLTRSPGIEPHHLGLFKSELEFDSSRALKTGIFKQREAENLLRYLFQA